MERLTIESNVFEGHTLKCLCSPDKDGYELYCCEYCNENCNNDCYNCEIQQAFDRLAAYEDTGLTPKEIEHLKAFKAYFDKMYKRHLEIVNWNLNGDLESFDNYYEEAINSGNGKRSKENA